ncbi:hypothetical protein H9L39_10325, partial [Fusarium oxysporum f. sp. albedinis]
CSAVIPFQSVRPAIRWPFSAKAMRRPPKRVGGFSVSNARLGSNTNTFFLHLCSDTRLARREAEMKQFDIVFPALAQNTFVYRKLTTQVILRPANRVWEYVLYIIVIFSSILPACLDKLVNASAAYGRKT